MKTPRPKLSREEREELLTALQTRFEKNMNRHKGLEWTKVRARLEAQAEKLWSLNEMERTGGEPDVVGQDKKTGEYLFYDCSAESPGGRRSVCYDREGLESRKEHKPKNNAIDMATAMGIELLTEEQYRELQKLGRFRYEDVELGENTVRDQKTRRRALLRSPLRHGLRVSQRCALVLCRPRVPRLAKGLSRKRRPRHSGNIHFSPSLASHDSGNLSRPAPAGVNVNSPKQMRPFTLKRSTRT